MPRVLSDEQMMALEAEGQAKAIEMPQFQPEKKKRTLSDDQMNALVKSGAAKEIDLSEPSGVGQTFLESFANTATLGYLPQIQATVGKFMPNPNAALDQKLKSQGFKIKQPEETYTESRDANIRRMDRQARENPKAAAAGTIAGIGASALVPQSQLAQGATALERIAQGAKTGAALGAIANPGDTEGEVGLQLEERLKGAATGGALGGALSSSIEALRPIKELIKKGSRKLASALTGVSEQDIQTYAKQTQEVDKLFKESGGQISEAADQIRTEVQSKIRSAKSNLNQAISDALAKAPQDPVIEINPILQKLQEARSKINPNLKSEATSQLDDMITRVSNEATDGKINLQKLSEIKEFLQERAKSAYYRDGQIFSAAKEAAQAAKGAAAVARKVLNPLAPEIAQANNKLSLLHSIEDKLNRNLIAPGKPEASLLAAGSGTNLRNERMIEQLSEVSGYPLLDRARQLSAARTFGNPQLLPIDTTGKAVARQVGGALLGTGVGGPVGGAIGAALTSPAALKAVIKTTNLFKNTPSITAFAQNNPLLFQVALNSLNRKNISSEQMRRDQILGNPQILDIFKNNPVLIENIKDDGLKERLKKAVGQ